MKKLSSRLPSYCLLVLLAATIAFSCKESSPTTDLSKENIIPKPVTITPDHKGFFITNKIVINSAPSKGLDALTVYLASQVHELTGLTINQEQNQSTTDAITLSLDANDSALGEEGYILNISEANITIQANAEAGIFNGIQTLLQIIPLHSYDAEAKEDSKKFLVATGTIRDYPEYSWRGSMLDVARHFFSVEDVKKYIDLISQYKVNVLHLHLSDDQGWRIEIKSWPKLATHGGSTEVGGGDGGYYTQEQYKDIQAYAASRFITIVPEIDLPGHINSALASYGELNGGIIVPQEGRVVSPLATTQLIDEKNKPTDLYSGIKVGWSTLRLDKKETFQFVEDVIRELSAITTGSYIHIGGDEAHVTKKEDYIVFINRFDEIVKANNKKMIGWEEAAQANLDSSATIQYWHSSDYAELAAEKGAHIIMSPSKHAYLDMQYDSLSRIGLHWAAYIEVDEAYNWDPVSLLPGGVDKAQIRGVEAPLWTETVETMADIEYLVFPRLPGIAEIGWSPAAGRNWDEYKIRLAAQAPRWRMKGIDFYPSKKVDWVR